MRRIYLDGIKALGLGLALLLPLSALAYIGPGAGFAILGSFMVFFFAFVAAVLSMLIWPVRAVYRFIQVKRLGIKPHVDRVVILGLDGLDPKRAQKLMDQGKLPHFKALARQGCFHPLATTYPAISPVAWSTFATGVNPGKHAIFDFLAPDRKTYLPVLSSTHIGKVDRVLKLGKYRIPLGRPELRLLRKSVPFWKILGDHWIFSHVLRVPITWPPEKFYGALLSAMCVPDLKGSQGTFTFYTTAAGDKKHTGGVEIKLERNGDGFRAYLPGPENSLTEKQEELRIPFTLSRNGSDAGWTLKLPDRTVKLAPGKYSGWVPLTFKAGVKTATVLGVPSGTLIQPCKYYNSDWGSVPSFLWWMYAPERFISWLFHDSAYEFHYVWIRLPDGAIWKKLPITRAQADWAFCDYGLRAQDGTARDAAVVFNAVNLAGWAVWPKPACRLV